MRASERVSVCEVALAKFANERIRERGKRGRDQKRARAFDRPRRILRRFHRLIESSAPRCDRDRIAYAREHANTHRVASHRSLRFNDSNERPADIRRISLIESGYRLITHFEWIDNSDNRVFPCLRDTFIRSLCQEEGGREYLVSGGTFYILFKMCKKL